ncbi:MAG: pyruvate formate-lyase [Clostridia bacterium]|nr:pyruvate formate-lyase [Clostridia bacterium]
MNEYIANLKKRYVTDKSHHALRQTAVDKYQEAAKYQAEGLDDITRAVRRLRFMLENEKPVVFNDEKIALMRTVPVIQEIFTPEEFEKIASEHYIHEQGKICNINPMYSMLVDCGFDSKRAEIKESLKTKEGKQRETLLAMLETMDIIQEFCERYRQEAVRVGNTVEAETLSWVPMNRPRTFLEALQFLRIVHYCLWVSFNYHNTFGRFDQYMYPYFKADIDAGRITEDEALELVEEFFICCNKDSDLYTGMQQGDNGQSMVLGGLNIDGSDSYNELSEICMKASLELKLIDPKINLRVSKKTPLERYKFGTLLTKQGLGFPQYANDDVVIKALKDWGYDEEDAYQYVVAACWEFIIPGYGMDIVNVNGLSFTQAVIEALEDIEECDTFDAFLDKVRAAIKRQAEELMASISNVYMEPSPLMSLIMKGCVESGNDISLGGKYNNYGFHGTGLSTAVDSLASIEKFVYEEKAFTGTELKKMLKANFEGYEDEKIMMRYDAPKMGNDDDKVDRFATLLLDWYADAFEGKKNDKGGIFRAGTGSAMYYIWHSKDVGATPDGRVAGEAIAANYSPSLFSRCDGPVSIIKSFAKPHLSRVANGGPLTIELHDSVFRNDDSITKVAMFIKSFIDLGGHQMQINAVNRDELLDAKAHPENHRNLIVRVWGWSGYFVELDEVYQDHILERMELAI